MQSQLVRLVDLLGSYSSAVLSRRLLDESTHGGLTPAQYEAMMFIRRHGACVGKSVVRRIGASASHRPRAWLDRMVRKGLVDRRE